MGLAIDLVLGCYQTVRETLPSTVDEGGAFISGMCWAFCLHWIVLILVTYWYLGGQR